MPKNMPSMPTGAQRGYAQLPTLPAYTPTPQTMMQLQPNADYTTLAMASQQSGQQLMDRAAARQAAVMAGYQQQIANSRTMGEQAYRQLQGGQNQVVSDAEATRMRNMGRIDQYGQSMRGDLAAQSQAAMSAARYAAIKRGLGNTTISDSLMRGQQFDNQRQQMALEDQLLANRISTDAQLSNAYQAALSNRAQSLNAQRNQNIGMENQLFGQRLGYISSIQDDTQSFDRTANLFGLQQQMLEAERNRIANNPVYAASLNPPPAWGRLGRTPGVLY
jgi:hypothetical protein